MGVEVVVNFLRFCNELGMYLGMGLSFFDLKIKFDGGFYIYFLCLDNEKFFLIGY